jgi:hypothetical protein
MCTSASYPVPQSLWPKPTDIAALPCTTSSGELIGVLIGVLKGIFIPGHTVQVAVESSPVGSKLIPYMLGRGKPYTNETIPEIVATRNSIPKRDCKHIYLFSVGYKKQKDNAIF